MAKKSFKDNPALRLISAPDEDSQEHEEQISISETIVKAPEGYKINPVYVETKSRRLQLILQPSLFERVKSGANTSGLSVNEYVHQILDNATRQN